MYIFRWLMKHPVIILALYFLSIIAILYSMKGGDSVEGDAEKPAEVQTASSTDVDLTQAPAIEPSTLTTVLVTGNEGTEELKLDADSAEVTENSETKATTDKLALTAEFSEADPEEMLLMAREAYWNNGLDESAEIYKQLIELNPGVIDYRGELGNVYWRQGFPKKAAELYASISIPMIEAGNADRVANMVGFIGLFYPEKATAIHERLQAEKQ